MTADMISGCILSETESFYVTQLNKIQAQMGWFAWDFSSLLIVHQFLWSQSTSRRKGLGVIICFDCFKTNWSVGILQNTQPTQKAEVERLSVNHPLQESHITYSLRNCDTEVSNWFEINNILFPRFKTDTVQIYHFLGKRAL